MNDEKRLLLQIKLWRIFSWLILIVSLVFAGLNAYFSYYTTIVIDLVFTLCIGSCLVLDHRNTRDGRYHDWMKK